MELFYNVRSHDAICHLLDHISCENEYSFIDHFKLDWAFLHTVETAHCYLLEFLSWFAMKKSRLLSLYIFF